MNGRKEGDVLQIYVKPWCPWCLMARSWLTQRGYAFAEIDVTADPAAYGDMVRISGQTRAPTAVVGSHVLPDFGPSELEAFLAGIGYRPDETP